MKTVTIFFLMSVAVTLGCGRKGPLIPPEALVPATVDSLSVQQKGEELQLLWSAPGKEKSGRTLKDLAGFRLHKRQIRGDGSDCAACDESWLLLKTVDLDAPEQTGRSGATFIYRDRLPPGAACQYRLTAYSKSGGISAPALSKIIRLQPPQPPPTLQVTVLPASIGMTLASAPVNGGTLKGYNIYRRTPDTPMPPLPYGAAPPSGQWEDKQVSFNSSYLYAATALVAVNGEIVESSPSAEAAILFSLQELH